MYVELSDVFWLMVIGLILWHWWESLKVRETALKAATNRCKEMDLQLLDSSVGQRGIWVKKDSHGRLRWWRRYIFDFSSTGEDRYRGTVITLGDKILHIEMEAHKF